MDNELIFLLKYFLFFYMCLVVRDFAMMQDLTKNKNIHMYAGIFLAGINVIFDL